MIKEEHVLTFPFETLFQKGAQNSNQTWALSANVFIELHVQD